MTTESKRVSGPMEVPLAGGVKCGDAIPVSVGICEIQAPGGLHLSPGGGKVSLTKENFPPRGVCLLIPVSD